MHTFRTAPLLALGVLVSCAAPPVDPPDGGVVDAGSGGPLGLETQTTACARIGGLDRIVVNRQDFRTGTCAMLVLVSPGSHSPFADVAVQAGTPFPWGIESLGTGSGTCRNTSGTGIETIEDASGHIVLHSPDGAFMPDRMDIAIDFPTDGGDVSWDAEGVEVKGSC